MPVLEAMWELVKRQNISYDIFSGPACYAVCNNACGVASGSGLVPALCDVNGDFAAAMLNVYECVTRVTSDIGVRYTTVGCLGPPLGYCSASFNFLSSLSEYEATVSAAVISGRISSLNAQLDHVTSSLCSQYSAANQSVPTSITCSNTLTGTLSNTTAGYAASTVPTSILLNGTSAGSSTTSATSEAAASATDNGLSKGAIAGVAAGATIAAILMVALVVSFIWWHRRKRRDEKATAQERKSLQDRLDKAQLHSEDYKPHREELQGSRVPLQIRMIDGVHEVEHQDISRIRSELSANEIAAAELDRPGPRQAGIDSP